MIFLLLLSIFSFSTVVDYVMHFKVSPQKANYERRVDVNLACFDPKEVKADEVILIDNNILTLNLTFTQTKAIQILQPKSSKLSLDNKCKLFENGKLIAYVYPKEKGNYYDFFFVGLNPNSKYNLICNFKLSSDFDEKAIKPAIVNNYDWREYLSVFFPIGEFELTPKIKFELDRFFKVIPKEKICILYLIGYADSTPIVRPETLKKVKNNRELAYKRVKNVLDYLITNSKLRYNPISEDELLRKLNEERNNYSKEKNGKKEKEEKNIKKKQNVEKTSENETLIKSNKETDDLASIYEILNNLSKGLKKDNNSQVLNKLLKSF